MSILVSVAIALGTGQFGPTKPRELHCTIPFDVVHLIKKGKRTEGQKNIKFIWYGNEYQFSNEANRAEFKNSPEKYEVQLGGACGRMGLLSGHGSPERYAIHKGKLYFFASEGCRKSFLSKPHESLEFNDLRFEKDALGTKAVDRALKWMGGADALKQINQYSWEFKEIVPSSSKTYAHTYRLTKHFPSMVEITDKWNDSAYSSFTSFLNSYTTNSNGAMLDMHPEEQEALVRLSNRDLLSIMHPFAYRQANAKLLSSISGIDIVAIYHEQTRNIIEIDKSSGKVLATEFFGKTPSTTVGRTRYDFTSWSEIKGVKVPTGWVATHNGKLNKSLSRSGVTYELRP